MGVSCGNAQGGRITKSVRDGLLKLAQAAEAGEVDSVMGLAAFLPVACAADINWYI